jgi:hypothetical protein
MNPYAQGDEPAMHPFLRRSILLATSALALAAVASAQPPPEQPESGQFQAPLPHPRAQVESPAPDGMGPDDDVFFVRGGPGVTPPAMAPMPPEPLTDEKQKQALEFLTQESPELVASIQALQKDRPEQYRSELRIALRDLQSISRFERDDPPRAQELRRERTLERQSRDLVRRARNATQDHDRTALRSNLASVLDELFELREHHRELMIERLEKELQTLRQTTEKRHQNKDRIVANRLEELLGSEDDLRW